MEQDVLRVRMEGAVLSAMMPGAYLAGLKSLRETMRDADFRKFYGHMLLHEIMPCLDADQKDKEECALTVSQALEDSRQATFSQLDHVLTQYREYALPLLSAGTPCLCLGLAMLAMLYAGPHDAFPEDEGVLRAFSGHSCDMPPESLSYAVLSDGDLWGEDLRERQGLLTLFEDQLRDLQILGIRGAVNRVLTRRVDEE